MKVVAAYRHDCDTGGDVGGAAGNHVDADRAADTDADADSELENDGGDCDDGHTDNADNEMMLTPVMAAKLVLVKMLSN